jgi:4-nitrophenyl phosphatase
MPDLPFPIRALILDMDGVLWRDDQPIGDLPAVFSGIKNLHLKCILATNNATLSGEKALVKLKGFGVELERWQIVNSADAAAHYLKKRFPSGGPIFVVGESALVDTLLEQGFYKSEDDVLAVVAGMDREITYAKLGKASSHVRSGALFVGTNPDRTFPTPQGLMPGAGAILAFLQAATDIPPIIIGKPEPEMYRVALERLSTAPGKTLVVGDRLETDIIGAQKIGCRTALVLSGVTSEKSAALWQPAPDIIAPDLTALIGML